jgi:hypothetical protein
MAQPNDTLSAYFKLGEAGVRLLFPDHRFKEKACEHIFLSDIPNKAEIAAIDYIQDETVSALQAGKGRPNVVGIAREELEDGSTRILLNMFGEFSVALDYSPDMVCVRYPSCAPVRLLLDDVFQAAMQPILDRLEGFILHGACMVRDGQAIVFMGSSGAGKSTTAFNLTRFGFQCYADDAVLVTPGAKGLIVWPLSREFSLRPLAFSLFEKQEIKIGPYQKDGRKYYFRQTAEALPGAELKHICFLNLRGEPETSIARLNPLQTRMMLEQNDRHFSFMGRKNARKYARILANKTPVPLKAQVGTDLNAQGRAFHALYADEPLITARPKNTKPFAATRTEKVKLIRRAWSQPDQKALIALIPLLGDFDPHVFRLALSFFQTLPTAKLQTVALAQQFDLSSATFPAAWVRGFAWLHGCGQLLAQSSLEVTQQFVFSWITSAPILFPFLHAHWQKDKAKADILKQAWFRYLDRKNDTDKAGMGNVLWLENDNFADLNNLCRQVESDSSLKRLTIVPVIGPQKTMDNIYGFFKACTQHGFKISLHRHLPLCCLKELHAHTFLAHDAFDLGVLSRAGHMLLGPTGKIVHLGTHITLADFNAERSRIAFLEKPFKECHNCGLFALGLCRGGYFSRALTGD